MPAVGLHSDLRRQVLACVFQYRKANLLLETQGKREATNFDVSLCPCAVRGLPAVCQHGLRDSRSYSKMDGTNKVCRFKTVCVLAVWSIRRNVQRVDSGEVVMAFCRETCYVSNQLTLRRDIFLAQPVVAGIIKDFPALHRKFGVRNLVHKSPIILIPILNEVNPLQSLHFP